MAESAARFMDLDVTRRLGRLAGLGVFEWYPAQGTIQASELAWQLLGHAAPLGSPSPAMLWSRVDPEDRDQLLALGRDLSKSTYGEYLIHVADEPAGF